MRQVREPGGQIDETEPGHGAADEVIGQERLQGRKRQRKVVAFPERRPRQDDQQEPDFEKERDVDEPTDQMLPPRLHFREALDALVDVLVASGLRLQLEADGKRAGDLAFALERVREIVEQQV